ncbi:MAG: histidine--tRNA ligase [bacterium]
MDSFKAPRGTRDILPEEVGLWQHIEEVAGKVFASYGYQEIRTPIFEVTELFARGIGETSDIVNKEMYTFADRKGRNLTLRPENTASVVRAVIEHGMLTGLPLRLYYLGPMFRYERPQAGRSRQFHQLGTEAMGSSAPGLDAEVITMVVHLLQDIGLTGLEVQINSVGCFGCRGQYRQSLVDYFGQFKEDLCPDCQVRLERNPLRILDCKASVCSGLKEKAPPISDSLCQDCSSHLGEVTRYLKLFGIDYTRNPKLVRGLDYYTRTAFEVVDYGLGAQNAVAAGGRYDNLIEEMGGRPTPAMGFAAGCERLVLCLKERQSPATTTPVPDLLLAAVGLSSDEYPIKLLQELRRAGLSVLFDWEKRGLKAQLKMANRTGVKQALILGPDEWDRQVAILKDMETGKQKEIILKEVADKLKEKS